jgi:hypothetical protein
MDPLCYRRTTQHRYVDRVARLYAANLVYTLATRRDVFAPDEPRAAERGWSLWVSVTVLVTETVVIALEAEIGADGLAGAATRGASNHASNAGVRALSKPLSPRVHSS